MVWISISLEWVKYAILKKAKVRTANIQTNISMSQLLKCWKVTVLDSGYRSVIKVQMMLGFLGSSSPGKGPD
jgi:hypothetical protein